TGCLMKMGNFRIKVKIESRYHGRRDHLSSVWLRRINRHKILRPLQSAEFGALIIISEHRCS
ncbi:MAG TPA: hypothetical protein VN843_03885, partial [Anaerolineales bacterium]|nr:hypothetical protein [Anaerolineales bacterium]